MKRAILAGFLLFPCIVFAQLNGIKKIGTPLGSGCSGPCDYSSLTLAGGAFQAINGSGINGNLELEIYTNLPSEDGTITLNSYTDIGGPHTITIRPRTTSMVTVSGANAGGGLIALTGADRVIFDGRPASNQTQSIANRFLTIRNTGTASTISVSVDAISNSFRSLIIEGRNVNTTGVFNVGGGTSAGNDELTIDLCDIKNDATGGALPLRGIVMDGGSGQNNDNARITNNRIYDFFVPTGSNAGGTGIHIGNFNTNVTMSGNSIYQTANRTAAVNVTYRGITVDCATGSVSIQNNFFGGTVPSAGGAVFEISATGSKWVNAKIIDIVEVGFSATSIVSGNLMRGVTILNSRSTDFLGDQAALIGIALRRGRVNVINNAIGGTVANGNLRVEVDATSSPCVGIAAGISLRTASTGTGIEATVEGNTIDNMQLAGSGTTAPGGAPVSSLVGIYVNRTTGNTPIILRKNVIGHVSGAPTFSMSFSGGTFPATNVQVQGIYNTGTLGALVIDKNTIANIGHTISANVQLHGIHMETIGQTQITGNKIFALDGAGGFTQGTSGMHISGAGVGSVLIARNIVYDIAAKNGAPSDPVGISLNVTSTLNIPRIENNMITLGEGIAANRTVSIRGISVSGVGGTTVRVYANSVAIFGNAAPPTFALTASSINLDLRANILSNTRSGTGPHRAMSLSTFSTNSNRNLFYSNVPGDLTLSGSTSRDLAAWQIFSGEDANSVYVDITPAFLNTATGNLRIPDNSTALVNNNVIDKGAANPGGNPVTEDVDRMFRTNITDIGACEVATTWLGTTSTAWNTGSNWSGGLVPSCGGRELVRIGPNIPGIVLNQPTITTTANFRDMAILEDAIVTLSGSGHLEQCATGLTPYGLRNAGTINLNTRQITLYGDFVQDDTFNQGTGVVLLNGSSTQTISGDASLIRFHDLNIFGGGAKIINRLVYVDGILNLSNGRINTSTVNPLVLSTSGTYTGGSNASHINGIMGKQTNSTTLFNFPIGAGGKIRPLHVTPTNALSTLFYAQYFNQSAIDNIGTAMAPGIVSVSDIEYWRVSRSGSANALITLTWDATSFVSAIQADRNMLAVVRWNGSQWANHFQTSNIGTQASGSVLSQFVGVFDAYYTLGSSTTNNPLPIELLYFRAALAEGMVRAEWATEMEESFDRFELEKASSDLVFTKIGEVKSLATGEPWKLRTYSHIDETPYIGDNYYRLKAIDLDGTFQYYNVVRVFNPGEGTLNVYPNPIRSTEVLTVKVDFTPTPQDKVILMNLQGTEVQHTAITGGGINEITLGNNVKPGLYLLRYTSPAFQKTFKVVVR